MQDTSRCAATQAAGSEQTSIVIGVDADGTVRVSQYRQWGRFSAAYFKRDQAWLRQNIGRLLDEAICDAKFTSAPQIEPIYYTRDANGHYAEASPQPAAAPRQAGG